MRLELAGWSRDCGARKIAESDLREADASGKPDRYGPLKTYLYPDSQGEVVVEKRAAGLALNGNFLLTMKFTRDDIAAMARVAFKDVPFETVVKALART